MRAGAMDRRVTIQTLTDGQDSHGGKTEAWTTLAEVWAEVVPLNGREFLQSAQVNAGASLKVRIYWRNDFDEKARILHDGVAYDIVYIAEIDRRVGLEIMCKRP